MFAILVQVEVRPDRLDAFAEAIAVNARTSVAAEPGCLRFEVFQDSENAVRWVFFEQYVSEDAWLAHRESPHFLVYKAVADVALVSRTLTRLTPRTPLPAS